jgi:hypothetical protein
MFADEKYKCMQQTLVDLRMNGCRLKPQLLGPVAEMLYEPVIKSINFELKCPYKAGIYNVTNFKMNLNTNLPLPNLGNYCLKVELIGKLKGQKDFENFVSFGGAGTIKQK